MRSIVAVTNELDDAGRAVQELSQQIEAAGPLGKNSCGIVFCDVELDHEAFTAELRKQLPFEVVGCTSIATFDTKKGAQIMTVVLLVLTADDARFAVELTDMLTSENVSAQLKEAYGRAKASLGEAGKLIFLVPPFDDATPLDDYVDVLSEVSGDTPIFGGLPSSNVADGDILMYGKGRSFADRAAIVLVGGNVRPLFSVQNVVSTFFEQKGIVTKADKNIVYTVGDKSFVDYLRSVELPVDDLIAQGDLAVYVSMPLKVNMSKNELNDGIPVVRTIKELSPSDGSGVLFGAISENSVFSVATMKRQDIQDSCEAAIREISEKIEAAGSDYTYTTLICVSCGGRYMVMADDKDVEGNVLVERLPAGLKLSGFYAYGEICPTIVRDGRAVNRVHNESIVMCAL